MTITIDLNPKGHLLHLNLEYLNLKHLNLEYLNLKSDSQMRQCELDPIPNCDYDPATMTRSHCRPTH